MRLPGRVVLIVILAIAGTSPSLAQPSDPTSQALRQASEQLARPAGLEIEGEPVHASHVLAEFYADRGFQPAWTSDRLEDLNRAIAKAEAHGLLPSDYHTNTLSVLGAKARFSGTPSASAQLEILASDALLRLALDLHHGKTSPASFKGSSTLPVHHSEAEAASLLRAAIAAQDIEAYLESLAPPLPAYERLKAALKRYRQVAETTPDWPQLPDGPVLKLGRTDPQVRMLRNRLRASGDLDPDRSANSDFFDAALEEAVKAFQQQAALDADGIVGPQTRKALNVTPQEGVDQIRVTMERMRWVGRDLGADMVLINIPAFRLYLVDGNDVAWSSKVILGRTDRPTPSLMAQMSYIVVNPEWVVPPTILRKDKLPLILKDPEFFDTRDYIVRNQLGQRLDPEDVNFRQLGSYQLVQPPGEFNALGRIKFIFPNSHFVFLHDTPDKHLFERTVRTFSSGCIRLEDPFNLAAKLLANQARYDDETLARIRDEGATSTIVLQQKRRILVVYWTADAMTAGEEITVYQDIYGRNAAVLKALDSPR